MGLFYLHQSAIKTRMAESALMEGALMGHSSSNNHSSNNLVEAACAGSGKWRSALIIAAAD
jgi:hypothetical protein